VPTEADYRQALAALGADPGQVPDDFRMAALTARLVDVAGRAARSESPPSEDPAGLLAATEPQVLDGENPKAVALWELERTFRRLVELLGPEQDDYELVKAAAAATEAAVFLLRTEQPAWQPSRDVLLTGARDRVIDVAHTVDELSGQAAP
jgi:hypothetical protein